MSRAELLDRARRFVAAFNRNDLDAVMAFFADDAIYIDEFNGRYNVGQAAIRAAFEPLFIGGGKVEFYEEDLQVEADAGRVQVEGDAGRVTVMWRCTFPSTRVWTCTLSRARMISWRGFDLLHFQGDKLVRKQTIATTRADLFES